MSFAREDCRAAATFVPVRGNGYLEPVGVAGGQRAGGGPGMNLRYDDGDRRPRCADGDEVGGGDARL